MLQTHSHFHRTPTTPPPMNYILKFLGEPIFTSPNWLEIHRYSLQNGYAVNAMGCLFTLMPGVTIQQPTVH